MTHLKARWTMLRHDHEAWGESWWYCEFGADGWLHRQVDVYDSGVRLRYGPSHLRDEFGALGVVRLDEFDRGQTVPLSAHEFEVIWGSVGPSPTPP